MQCANTILNTKMTLPQLVGPIDAKLKQSQVSDAPNVGFRKHLAAQCTTDLSKTKCFKCGVYGHVSLNCRMKAGEGGKDNRKAKKICQAGQLEQEWNGLTGKTKRGQTKTSAWWHSEQYGWNDWNVESMQEAECKRLGNDRLG